MTTTATTLPGRSAPLPEGGTAVLYVHDGGEVSCGAQAGPYRVGHSMTLYYESEANPDARELWTDRGTWERVDAAFLAESEAFRARLDPELRERMGPLSCEVCGATAAT